MGQTIAAQQRERDEPDDRSIRETVPRAGLHLETESWDG